MHATGKYVGTGPPILGLDNAHAATRMCLCRNEPARSDGRQLTKAREVVKVLDKVNREMIQREAQEAENEEVEAAPQAEPTRASTPDSEPARASTPGEDVPTGASGPGGDEPTCAPGPSEDELEAPPGFCQIS